MSNNRKQNNFFGSVFYTVNGDEIKKKKKGYSKRKILLTENVIISERAQKRNCIDEITQLVTK